MGPPKAVLGAIRAKSGPKPEREHDPQRVGFPEGPEAREEAEAPYPFISIDIYIYIYTV